MKVIVFVAALLAAFSAQAAPNKGWKTIISPAGFAVEFPSTWYVGSPDPVTGGVSIANFAPGTGAEGVVIGKDQATISVFPNARWKGALAGWAHAQTRWDSDVTISEVRLRPAHPRGCSEAIKAESLSNVGPGAYQQVTAYYCMVSDVPIAVQLINRRGDPNLPGYRQILLRVAESLRPPK